jgi:hypothetical protein
MIVLQYDTAAMCVNSNEWTVKKKGDVGEGGGAPTTCCVAKQESKMDKHVNGSPLFGTLASSTIFDSKK